METTLVCCIMRIRCSLLADSMSDYLQIFSGTVTLRGASPIQCNLITRQVPSVEMSSKARAAFVPCSLAGCLNKEFILHLSLKPRGISWAFMSLSVPL